MPANNARIEGATKRSAPIFFALGDETRLHLVSKLGRGTALSIANLTDGTNVTRQAITKHLRVLEDAGLVRRTVRGRIHSCRLVAEPLAAADEWFTFYSRFWSNRLDDLESAINNERTNNSADDSANNSADSTERTQK